MFDFIPRLDDIDWSDDETPPKEWAATGRTKEGKPVYVVYATFTKRPNPVLAVVGRSLPIEPTAHTEGGTCPHCGGSGRYSAHRGHFHREKCFRCDGKGTLNARDLAFLKRRQKGAGPVCIVVSA